MVWERTIPDILEVEVVLGKCGEVGNLGCGQCCSGICLLTYVDQHPFASLESCKEARKYLLPRLSNVFPCVSPSVCIRSDSTKTVIYVKNFDAILKWIDDNLGGGGGDSWQNFEQLRNKSYHGDNVSSLLVNSKHVFQSTHTQYCWDEVTWTTVLESLFKKLDMLVVGFFDTQNPGYYFSIDNEEDRRKEDWVGDSDSEQDTDDYGADKGCPDREDRCVAEEVPSEAGSEVSNSHIPKVVNMSKLIGMFGDFLANVLDRVEKRNPGHFQDDTWPTLYYHQGGLKDGLELQELQVLNANDRFDFDRLYLD